MDKNLNASNAGQVKLGSFTVNRIGLGTNRITDTENARAVLRRAAELGINFIDTADIYQRGQSEETIGRVFPSGTKTVIVASKGGMSWEDHGAINDPSYLRKAIDASLRRLGRSQIDLYQLHRTDPNIPIEETAGVLKEMQDQGKVKHIGLSEVGVETIERARTVVEIVSVQNHYNLVVRKHEAVLEYCEAHGIVFIPFFPLGKGQIVEEAVGRIAQVHDASPVQISIAWLLKRSPAMLPIPGTLSIKHLESDVAAANIALSAEEFELLNSVVTFQPARI